MQASELSIGYITISACLCSVECCVKVTGLKGATHESFDNRVTAIHKFRQALDRGQIAKLICV